MKKQPRTQGGKNMHTTQLDVRVNGNGGTDENEQQLVVAAKTGCSDAFNQLTERYYGPMLRYFTRHTGNHELAADLAQDTFCDAFRRLDHLQVDRPFPAWLFRIGHYNLLHAWRRQGTRRIVSLDTYVDQAGEAQRALHQPDRTISVNERDCIRQTLAMLTPTLREPLLLHSGYGYTSEEIANILGIAPTAVRQRLARAKEQFRQVYNAAQHDVQNIRLVAA
jgi:RNA polymerase sigma-70 factor (ECF subfamily)